MTRNPDLKDFDVLRSLCDKTSRIAESVIDGFLVGFAARNNVLEKKMEQNFTKYRHILSRFRKADVELFRSQYLMHEVFKKGGFIKKFPGRLILFSFPPR